MQMKIDGMLEGPPMSGVKTYPYKVNERLYKEDFAGMIASRITHPYLVTARPSGSVPFNILSNSASSGSTYTWKTEHETQYTSKSPFEARSWPGSGVRTEQM